MKGSQMAEDIEQQDDQVVDETTTALDDATADDQDETDDTRFGIFTSSTLYGNVVPNSEDIHAIAELYDKAAGVMTEVEANMARQVVRAYLGQFTDVTCPEQG